MEIQKRRLKEIAAIRDKEIRDLNEVLFVLMKFEDTGVEYY